MESEIELIRKKLKENRENSELTEILFRSKQFQSLQQKKKGIRPFGHKPQ
jgi:stalled ribosome alternative rescue factor ArfA